MTRKLAIVMDPIEHIHPKKDTSLAMLLAAQTRGWTLEYIKKGDVYLKQGQVWARAQRLLVKDDEHDWFQAESPRDYLLETVDVILLRCDPPVDMSYMYLTYLLELVERSGVRVVNKPQGVRDANEKLCTAWFPDCCPETLVTQDPARLQTFCQEYKKIILKPLNGMGGYSIFQTSCEDPNHNVIMDMMTRSGQRLVMAQRYLPEIYESGDKRILLINGKPIDYALARFPKAHETRANLAAGGAGQVVPLTQRDHFLCQQVGPVLRDKGLLWVGLDVIGDYITEINVTSPTCAREIHTQTGYDAADALMECLG